MSLVSRQVLILACLLLSNIAVAESFFVSAQNVVMRQQPSFLSAEAGALRYQDAVTTIRKIGDWLLVRVNSGETGWVHGSTLSTSRPAPVAIPAESASIANPESLYQPPLGRTPATAQTTPSPSQQPSKPLGGALGKLFNLGPSAQKASVGRAPMRSDSLTLAGKGFGEAQTANAGRVTSREYAYVDRMLARRVNRQKVAEFTASGSLAERDLRRQARWASFSNTNKTSR